MALAIGRVYVPCSHCALYFYGGLTKNGLVFIPSQNTPSREETLGSNALCKHPSVLLYPVPPKVKIHKMALGSNHHPRLGCPC